MAYDRTRSAARWRAAEGGALLSRLRSLPPPGVIAPGGLTVQDNARTLSARRVALSIGEPGLVPPYGHIGGVVPLSDLVRAGFATHRIRRSVHITPLLLPGVLDPRGVDGKECASAIAHRTFIPFSRRASLRFGLAVE